MATTSNVKLCWKCEEEIHSDASQCPYCHANMTQMATKEDHAPPYRFVAAAPGESPVPTPLYSPYTTTKGNSREASPEAAKRTSAIKSEGQPLVGSQEHPPLGTAAQVLTPTVLLLSGAVFFLFGLVLFLCSHQGVFTLRWNANYWPLYFFASLPMLFWGWRTLKALDATSEET